MRVLRASAALAVLLAWSLLTTPRHIIWAQPINPPPAILKGSAPGGIGGACVGSSLIGYMDSSGRVITCVSSLWTVVGGSSGAVWGSITGTLSSQTDLQSALNLKANLASPTFTGTPSLPTGTTGVTQSIADNSTKIATTAYSDRAGISATYGAYASLPASGTRTGDQYFSSDSNYTFLWDGSAWRARYLNFPVVIPPLNGSLTWVNQGGSTASNTGGVLVLSAPSSGSANARSLVKTLAAGTFTFTVGFDTGISTSNFAKTGITLRESSSGKMTIFGPLSTNTCGGGTGQINCIEIDNYTNNTTFASTTASVSVSTLPKFLRIEDNGTNLIFSYSCDGQTFVTVGSAGHTSFLTANQIGITADPQNSQPLTLYIWHWTGV